MKARKKRMKKNDSFSRVNTKKKSVDKLKEGDLNFLDLSSKVVGKFLNVCHIFPSNSF